MPGAIGGAAAAAAGKEFLLEQELPDFEVAVQRAKESLRRSSSGTTGSIGTIQHDSATALSNMDVVVSEQQHQCDSCACPHLLSILPSTLDLTLIQSSSNHAKWMVKDPIAALHLHSQLESSSSSAAAGVGVGSSGGCITTTASTSAEEPVLYGEEQERWMVACTEGFPDTWHPWIHHQLQSLHTEATALPASSAHHQVSMRSPSPHCMRESRHKRLGSM